MTMTEECGHDVTPILIHLVLVGLIDNGNLFATRAVIPQSSLSLLPS